MTAFIELIESINLDHESLELGELAEHVVTISGLIEHHSKEKGEKGQARIENLEELINACRQFDMDDLLLEQDEEQNEIQTMTPLEAFLAHAALEAGTNQADQFQDSVQMMTLHSAKGLEFPLVFLAGMEEGLFPHKMSLDEGNLEEERRLCYVGITRAMETLYLTYAESRRLYGNENPEQALPFYS